MDLYPEEFNPFDYNKYLEDEGGEDKEKPKIIVDDNLATNGNVDKTRDDDQMALALASP